MRTKSNNTAESIMGLFLFLAIVFISLKLTNKTDLNWYWVLIPILFALIARKK